MTELSPADTYHKAYNYLHDGDYVNGFRNFEWRWHPDAIATLPEPFIKHTKTPVWQGESLWGKSVLVQMEMGYGDCIQFYRFLPLLKVLGVRRLVVLQTGSLHNLLAQMECIDHITNDETKGESQTCDYWIGSMSLAWIALNAPPYARALFPITKEKIVASEGYFTAPQAKNIQKLPGVNWGASHRYLHGVKSTTAERIAELCGTNCYSLNPEADGPFKSLPTTTWKSDWLETASYMRSMSVVVTVDTGTAHIAGALGVPCIVLLPDDEHVCWRWKNGRWYNSINTIRKNEWDTVPELLKEFTKCPQPIPGKLPTWTLSRNKMVLKM